MRRALAPQPIDFARFATKDSPAAALTKADSASARELFGSRMSPRSENRAAEVRDRKLTDGPMEMPYFPRRHLAKSRRPAGACGFRCTAAETRLRVNDRQWENQKKLYKLEEGIYVVPRRRRTRGTSGTRAHIDRLFGRLIEDLIVLEGIDPNRVYVMGYSAGGDGVYQLAPRMADRWAAAGMMAGHPNDVTPLGLRNVPFALQVGGKDAAYNRNKIAEDWGKKLDDLRHDDPGGYDHFVKFTKIRSHWMDREDAIALPWMASTLGIRFPSTSSGSNRG